MSGFATRDPAAAEFWDERFAAGCTPWDAGGVPAALQRFIERERAALGRRGLIPGCGSAYEAAHLDAAGFEVLAIDYAGQALARARSVLAPAVAQRVLRRADFFAFDAPPFDWIYERAFLPALPPALWPAWSRRIVELLRPGGLLIGFFLIDAEVPQPRRGPPFAATAEELDALLGAAFETVEDAAVDSSESIAVFAGRERWTVRRRR
jgi:SAM-dependent methyltransferase